MWSSRWCVPQLAARGYYVLLCAHHYTYQQIERRENQIRAALRGAGMDIDDEQVAFRGADWIVDWVNHHPSVAAWLKQQTRRETADPFRSWLHWESRPEHAASRWAADDRLCGLREPVCEAASGPGGVVRVVGPSGVGKSRLILEALRPSEADERRGYFHRRSRAICGRVRSGWCSHQWRRPNIGGARANAPL